MYIVAFGRHPRRSFFSLATIANTCELSARTKALRKLVAYILDLDNGVLAKSMPNLGLVNQIPPLPESLQRALILNSQGPASPFTPSPIASPGEEGFQETDRLL